MSSDNDELVDQDAALPYRRSAGAYLFGLRVLGLSGLPALPASPEEPRVTRVLVVGEAAVEELWRPAKPRRVVDSRLADGSLILAVDVDPALGYRIEAPGVGLHVVRSGGTEVLLSGLVGPDWFWQRLLFAQTLPIAAALQGVSLFHASAVRLRKSAVAVSAPSGVGKSSTAMHLIANGAEFFTDDILALEAVEGGVTAFAGPQFASVESSELKAASAVGDEAIGAILGETTKQHIRPIQIQSRLPVGALYLLGRDRRADSVAIAPFDAADVKVLLASGFIPHLDHAGRLVNHLEVCGRLAAARQIYRVQAPLASSAAQVAETITEHAARVLPV